MNNNQYQEQYEFSFSKATLTYTLELNKENTDIYNVTIKLDGSDKSVKEFVTEIMPVPLDNYINLLTSNTIPVKSKELLLNSLNIIQKCYEKKQEILDSNKDKWNTFTEKEVNKTYYTCYKKGE